MYVNPCEQDQDGTAFHPDPAHKLSANLYDIYHCCVYSEKTPDDGQRNCPKHVEFHSNNKFEKLVHLKVNAIPLLAWTGPEGFDALKVVARNNIRINLKVSRLSICEQYGLSGFDDV
jgi:hypothetical protein